MATENGTTDVDPRFALVTEDHHMISDMSGAVASYNYDESGNVDKEAIVSHIEKGVVLFRYLIEGAIAANDSITVEEDERVVFVLKCAEFLHGKIAEDIRAQIEDFAVAPDNSVETAEIDENAVADFMNGDSGIEAATGLLLDAVLKREESSIDELLLLLEGVIKGSLTADLDLGMREPMSEEAYEAFVQACMEYAVQGILSVERLSSQQQLDPRVTTLEPLGGE